MVQTVRDQGAEIAALARAHCEEKRAGRGTPRGLGREEDLVLLAWACDQHHIAVCPGALGRPLYGALKDAAVGAGGALRAAGWGVRMRNRIAHGVAGGYWSGRSVANAEKYSLTAGDFVAGSAQELDEFVVPQDVAIDPQPRAPATWDEWLRRARQGISVWALV